MVALQLLPCLTSLRIPLAWARSAAVEASRERTAELEAWVGHLAEPQSVEAPFISGCLIDHSCRRVLMNSSKRCRPSSAAHASTTARGAPNLPRVLAVRAFHDQGHLPTKLMACQVSIIRLLLFQLWTP